MLADLARGGVACSPPPYEINFVAESRGLADVVVVKDSGSELNSDLAECAADVFGNEVLRRAERYRVGALIAFLDSLPPEQAEVVASVCRSGSNRVSSAIAGTPMRCAAVTADAINLAAARHGLEPLMTAVAPDRLAVRGGLARQLVAAIAERSGRATEVTAA